VIQGSRLAKITGREQWVEEYFCNYEVDPSFRQRVGKEKAEMQIAATGNSGEIRAVEISRHPFYLATLFQPQLTSIATGAAHPIIVAYLQSAADNRKAP